MTSSQSDKNKYSLGVDYRNHFLQTQDNFTDDGTVSLNDKRGNKIWAIYAQDEFRFSEWGILSLGLRYDNYQTFGGTTAPRAALILKPDSNTNIKTIYGQSFRAPNTYELYYHDGYNTQKPTESLAPEKITNIDLTAERMLTSEIKISLHGFHYKVTNLIDATNDPDDGLKIFKNVNSITGQGFEVETEYKSTNGIRANASYTNQRVVDDLTKNILRASPQNLGKAGLWTSVYNRQLYLGTQLQWVGERFNRGNSKSRDYFLADLVISTEGLMVSSLDSSIGIYNIFDRKYDHPVSDDFQQTKIEQDGRSIRFNLTANF